MSRRSIRPNISSPTDAIRRAIASPTTCLATPHFVRPCAVRRSLRVGSRRGSDAEARALAARYDPITLARAVSYLYTKETRSSFAIEGETLTPARTDRFVAALRAAPSFDLGDAVALIRLQGDIVDPRYAAQGWRSFQNFVGETIGGYREKVHYICPKPEAVPELMEGWVRLTQRLLDANVEPGDRGSGCGVYLRLLFIPSRMVTAGFTAF